MTNWGRNNQKGFEPLSAQRGSRSNEPRVGDLTVGDYANGMPNIRLGEMFKSFGRQLPWVIILFVIGAAAAWHFTRDFKRDFSGDARIFVQLGDEYVYNPVGQAANGTGLATTIDTITLTEAAIMKNGEIIDQVIGEMTGQRLAPKKYEKVLNAPNERERKIAEMELRKEIAGAYKVMPRPKSSIIDVVFTHEDPDVAVETTNAFVDAYLSFRRQVFVEGSSDLITERREATEDQLKANEQAIARFLRRNNISDFTSEQSGLRERTEDLKASLNTTRASISETEAALARVEDQLRVTPETIDLYRDDRTAQRVAQAELELGQLLAKYLPTSDPVRQKQTELNELRALQSSYGGKASGGRRVGPNPTHQALETQRNTLASTADSLREREFTLQNQLNSADGKIRRLTSLTPEFQNLLRERETLNTRLNSYNAKEQESLVDAQQAEASAENVKVISYAKFPNKGRNMRLLMFVLAAGAWGLVLFFIAMIKVFLDPRLYAVPGQGRSRHDDMPEMDERSIPDYATIPEPVPGYNPGQPATANPYAAPAATPYMAAPLGGTVDYGSSQGAQPYEAQDLPSYQAPGYGTTAYADSYASQGQPQAPQTMQTGYAEPQSPPYQGNTALDLSQNPYLTGQATAGSFDDPTGVYGAQPNRFVDEYGNPIPPKQG